VAHICCLEPTADTLHQDNAREVGRGSGSEATVRAALPWNVAAEATRTLDDTGERVVCSLHGSHLNTAPAGLGDRDSRAGDGTMRSFSEGDITGLRCVCASRPRRSRANATMRSGRERRGSSMIPDSPGGRRESAARDASVLHESE
jgi:hypothetical protein